MKMEMVSYKEYERLESAIKGLSWVWQSYQREIPDGWYEFKYQHILRGFLLNEGEETLLAQVKHKRFPRCVKIPKPVYHEMKELASIYDELQDVLANPPYGSKPMKEFIN
ncbi:hypothetical protein I6N95_17505 [Vagococcus sp. BWB3-3]|uniref:Uncharacterized protein n=1 Tax=Vagococcus allomyrinae TaxID=2794353 RepID=A0A940PFX2_9ENTE|nr:hypothetical protein [Vagococcus allomyrinae]MBP1042816.1 hypothetical protein [Vagococcus allomyrinae]